jgi:predicted acetylornithine/succinylornithine family transaminase
MKRIDKIKSDFFLNTYKRIPLDLSYGEGVHLVTKDGQRYLDFFSGLAVNALGYANAEINEAIIKQLKRFGHVSNYYLTDVQEKLADLLIKYSGMSKVFFTNSGTEACEAAIKLIRKIKGPYKTIYSLSNSFHGRTYGAISLSARKKNVKLFSPLLQSMEVMTFNDEKELREKINSETAAVFIEFIQGEGGINILSEQFVKSLFDLRKEFGFLIIADEIQTGIGRTGKPFAFNHFEVLPDIVLVAKAIGGGLPLGAMLVSEELNGGFSPGDHGSTFGGNPVACAAGIIVLENVFEKRLYDSVFELGQYFMSELIALQERFNKVIKVVRGKGFMIGIELFSDCSSFVDMMRDRKVLVNCTNQNVIRILPPLIAKKNDIDFFLYNFHSVLSSESSS